MTKKGLQSRSGRFAGGKHDRSFEQYQPKGKTKMNKPINRIEREDVEAFAKVIQDRKKFDLLTHADEYQQIALKSAIYPGQGTALGLIYTALKGAGEAGEFAEHVGKAMRDDAFGQDETPCQDMGLQALAHGLTEERRALLIKELGDRLWYICASAEELGVSLSEVMLVNLMKLCDRGERDALRGSGDER